MTSTKTTRRALLSSLLSLLLCCSMLLGTTFAWFTDSVTSTGNIIKSGKLDVEMSWSDTNEDGTYKNAAEGAIFDYKFWEPGFTQTKYIKVENVGDLAFQYQLRVIPNDLAAEGTKLAEVIDVYCAIVEDGTTKNFGFAAPGRNDWGSLVKLGTLKELMAKETGVDDGVLLPRLENGNSVGSDKVVGINGENYTGHVTVCMALHMQEEAGNEYQDLSIGNGFKVELLAAQMSYEMDSFDHLYDQNAQWPVAASGSGSFATTPISSNKFTVEVKDLNDASGNPNIKVAVATVDRASVEEDTTVVTINVSSTATNPNVTVANGMTARTYEIDAIGLKEGNTTPVKMELYVGEDLSDPVELYHYGTKINSTYNPNSGYIIFETAEFSPFTVVFASEETESEPTVPGEGPNDLPEGMPTAKVIDAVQYENVEINWGHYGSWSPDTEDMTKPLESAYIFTAPHDSDTINDCAYKDWHCDFYVKLNRDLPAESIFLGGYYESFNAWVAFDNGDMTLKADEEVPLLGFVTKNPWTYAQVATGVHEFVCGVARKGDALEGATFTVMLRLTNPDDPTEYYNVNTVEYTFTKLAKKVSNDAELAAAVAAGETNIQLADGVYYVDNCGGKTLTISGSKNAVLKLKNEGEDGCDYSFGSAGTGVGSYTFNGITVDTTENTGNYKGYAYMGATFNDCDFVGAYSLNNANDFVFNRCTFDFKNGYFWTWGANSVTFNDCTFNGNSKTILAHGSASTVINIIDCDFAAAEKGYTGAGDNTAAVEMDPTGANIYTINFSGANTITDSYAGWTRVKDGSTGHIITGLN